jgi:hypothetical protein
MQLPCFTPGQMTFKCINCDSQSSDAPPVSNRDNVVIHRNNIRHTSQRVETLLPCMIYDHTLKHTTQITCPNAKCASLDMGEWGKFTDTGIRIQPDVLITNFMSVDKVMTGICRICGCNFTPSLVK